MTPATNTKDAIKQREKLNAEVDRCEEIAGTAKARQDAIKSRLGSIERERRERRTAAARTGEADDLGALDAEARDLDAETEDLAEVVRAAVEGRRQAESEFEQLHVSQFEPLAAEAEEVTVKAMEAMERLRRPYEEAIEAWNEARSAWWELAKANDLGPVPHAPLPELDRIFDCRPPRPPQVEAAGDAEQVEPERRPRTFEHVRGHRASVKMRAPNMTPHDYDRQLAEKLDDPSWREVTAA